MNFPADPWRKFPVVLMSSISEFVAQQRSAYGLDEKFEESLTKFIDEISQVKKTSQDDWFVIDLREGNFVKNGIANLSADDIPKGTIKLRITNSDKSVTTIGDYFLYCCKSLTEINFSGLTSVTTTIGNCFLHGCKSLTEINFSGLTSVTTIGHYFLSNCESLTEINFSGLTSVTTIGDYL